MKRTAIIYFKDGTHIKTQKHISSKQIENSYLSRTEIRDMIDNEIRKSVRAFLVRHDRKIENIDFTRTNSAMIKFVFEES